MKNRMLCVAAFAAAMSLLAACSTAMVGMTHFEDKTQLVESDKLLAVGTVGGNAALANAVALVGHKRTYLVTPSQSESQANILANILQTLDSRHLYLGVIVCNSHDCPPKSRTLRVTMDQNGAIQPTLIRIFYQRLANQPFSAQEQAQLSALGFRCERENNVPKNRCYRAVDVDVQPTTQSSSVANSSHRFKEDITLEFHQIVQTGAQRQSSVRPFAAAFDVLTLPVQIGGAAAMSVVAE